VVAFYDALDFVGVIRLNVDLTRLDQTDRLLLNL
jgi:hypothetical protein